MPGPFDRGYGSRLRRVDPRRGYTSPKLEGQGVGTLPSPRPWVEAPPADVIPQSPEGMSRFFSDRLRMFEERIKQIVHTYDRMRYADFVSINATVPAAGTDIIVLPRATNTRIYLHVVNTHALNRLFITFGTQATVLLGVPIEANLGFYELLFTVPQNDIHLTANGATTTAAIVYAELNATDLKD